MARYDASPTRLNDPINLDEAEAIAANPNRLGKHGIEHYTQRVWLTLRTLTNDLQNLNRTIQRLQGSNQRLGTASTLDPRDAVKYLTLDQFAEMGDTLLQQRVAHIRHIQQEAETIRSEVQRQAASIKLRIQLLLDDPELPDAAKTSLKDSLERMPEDIIEVPDLIGPGHEETNTDDGGWVTPTPPSQELDNLFDA
jgi:hypothetical protein